MCHVSRVTCDLSRVTCHMSAAAEGGGVAKKPLCQPGGAGRRGGVVFKKIPKSLLAAVAAKTKRMGEKNAIGLFVNGSGKKLVLLSASAAFCDTLDVFSWDCLPRQASD